MRQTISGLVAAFAVMTAAAAPAMACGYTPCGYAPTYTYAYHGCEFGCGWGYERLVDPATQYALIAQYPYPIRQYYYVNQGPTYTGPGAFAPYPAYEENAIPVYPYRYRYARRWHHRHYGPVLRRYY